MKKSELRQIIREEIRKTLKNEGNMLDRMSAEARKVYNRISNITSVGGDISTNKDLDAFLSTDQGYKNLGGDDRYYVKDALQWLITRNWEMER